MAAKKPQDAEGRRREIIERVANNEDLMALYRVARASSERGERIPAAQVRAEAEARRRRA
jgi:hypothetical protein